MGGDITLARRGGLEPSNNWSLENIFGKYGESGSSGFLPSMSPNGQGGMVSNQGWGLPAAGLAMSGWDMWNKNKAAEAAKEDADRRYALMLGDSQKNWAMKMSDARRYNNMSNLERAESASMNSGNGYITGDQLDSYTQTNTMVDSQGRVMSDPFSTGANGKVSTPAQRVAGSAFLQPSNPAGKIASRTTTTPQQVAGMSKVTPSGPNTRGREDEQNRVKKLTI